MDDPTRYIDPFGLHSVDPKNINFSQITAGTNANKMAESWDWEKYSPIRVIEVDGQLVTYDNRRLIAAQGAGIDDLPVQLVKPDEINPQTGNTWKDDFDKRLRKNHLGPKGTPDTPVVMNNAAKPSNIREEARRRSLC